MSYKITPVIYINPYKVFDLAIDSSETRIAANKTRILSMISSYEEEDKVFINGNQLSKKQILMLLEDLDKATTREYHRWIFENKRLLNFLECGHLNYFRSDSKTKILEDAGFLEFIAPYFGHQYDETLLQAIKAQDKETLALLSETSVPMTEGFENAYYKHANLYVENTISELKELQSKRDLLHMSERELLSYLPNRTIELYNMLPDYFSATRNLIGNEVYQLSVVLNQNFGRKDGASAIVNQGLKLKLDDAVRGTLESALSSASMRVKIPNFIVIGIVSVILLFLLKYLETNFF